MDRAQIFSLDIFIAVGIFILIILSTMTVWEYSREKISVNEMRNDMEIIARNSLSVLVETRGNPSNWSSYVFNESNINSLGLADGFLVLNQTKISSLVLGNYQAAKRILGILGPNYEFRLNLAVWNGNAYADTYSIGLIPNSSASEVVRVERFALLNGTWAKVTMKLWKSCEGVLC